jgi:hypothetical protein
MPYGCMSGTQRTCQEHLRSPAVTIWQPMQTPRLRTLQAALRSAGIAFGYPADETKREHNLE